MHAGQSSSGRRSSGTRVNLLDMVIDESQLTVVPANEDFPVLIHRLSIVPSPEDKTIRES
jgi:hypothetical protein